MSDNVVTLIIATAAGGIAAVTGFGIGSLLTPVLALSVDTRVAVAAVSIPHVVGTGIRCWLLRGGVDRRVLWSFGLTSAGGGLAGAALYNVVSSRWLNGILGVLLLFAAASAMSGLTATLRFRGWVAWVAGALSGLLGGLVGNQGGIRSAALLGFGLSRETLVGTATVIALFVDGARLPVYLATEHDALIVLRPWIALATIGVAAGTLLGSRILQRVPEVWFQRVLAVVLAVLGIVMLMRV